MAAINVWSGMQIVRDKRGRSPKVVVAFQAPELVFNPDEKAIARKLATTMTEVFRGNMEAGNWIDGRSLPSASPNTVKRRRHRLAQIERGGAAKRVSGKVGSGASPTSMPLMLSRSGINKWERRNNIERRYRTVKLGTTMPTAAVSGAGQVGRESGTLARSLSVAPFGKGMRIFVADIRGKIDRTGSNAWLRVLRIMKGVGRLSGLFGDPRIQEATRDAWRSCFALNGRQLGGELAKTAALLKGIAQEAEQLAESDDAQD